MKIILYGDYNHLIFRKIYSIKNSIVKISKNLKKDINFFKPDIIYIYEKDKCDTSNIYTVYITSNNFKASKNDMVCYIKPFDYETITQDKFHYKKLTHIESAIPEIIETSLNKKKGNIDFVNPGFISIQDILKLYKLNDSFNKEFLDNMDTHLNEEDTYTYKHKLSPIKNFFAINYTKKVNIYIPTYYRFNKTKKSVESILKCASISNYDIKIYIGDNNTNIPEMRNWLSSIECDVFFFDENKGKGHAVNSLHRQARNSDYVISFDSDLYTDDYSKNIIDEMIFILEFGFNIGIVSSNQYDLCQHWFDGTIKIFEERGMKMGETKDGVGIAGDALF